MSFTTDVKKEIAQNDLSACCQRAQLSALMQLSASLSINSEGLCLDVKTENVDTAKRIWRLMKDIYNVEGQLSVVKKMKLRKNYVYNIHFNHYTREVLNDLGILTDEGLQDRPSGDITKKECCSRAYLSGAFLASGSVNDPSTTSYHLEISTQTKALATYLQRLMKKFNLEGKIIERRNQFVVYLKASEQISDFLRCVNASNGVMTFEDERIMRDFKNSLTRLDNCEVANEMKTQKAARDQIEAIEKLIRHNRLNSMDEKVRMVANIRISYPEASLLELCAIYEERTEQSISKSGMKHRLDKLREEASSLIE